MKRHRLTPAYKARRVARQRDAAARNRRFDGRAWLDALLGITTRGKEGA